MFLQFLQLASKRNPLMRRFLAASVVELMPAIVDDDNDVSKFTICDDDDWMSEKS